LRLFVDSGILSFHTSQRSPSRSVLDYWQHLPAGESLLITTADHPLLTTEMIDYFCSAAVHSDADVILGIVSATLLRARYPQSRRTFIRLRGESFCGTNLFALRDPQAVAAVQFWTRAEQFRKKPWRLAGVFGPLNLVLFALRRFDLAAAVRRASRVIGARIAVVEMPFAECAIDVDSPSDLALASRILAERER
ncbi:MAG: MobA-like NTP transferase domain containing protein, partial [Candidatus Binatia bacterium]